MKSRVLSSRGLEPGGSATRPQFLRYGPVLLVAAAALLWGVSLSGIDIRGMNDLGLVSVLPPTFYVALLLLTAGFCLIVYQRRSTALPGMLLIGVLVLMLCGTMALVGQVPGFGPAWRHVGVTEYVLRHGSVDPNIDAYFNWPGFFILSAFAVQVAGLRNAIGLVPWAPIFFNLLYLGPLIVIFNSATDDRRVTWLGIWFFYLANWVGQDYYSPQALGYFLYLVILGILLRWFRVASKPAQGRGQRLRILSGPLGRARSWLAPEEGRSVASRPWQRVGLLLVLIALYAVTVVSHQLTPFAVLAAATVLVLFRRVSLRTLPVLMAVMTATWLTYMAVPFLSSRLPQMVSNVGSVGTAVGTNVTERLGGSVQHALVVRVRMVMACLTWGLALAGLCRYLRKSSRDVSYLLLGVAPFPLVLLQSYGGEMLLRVYLFSLPFAALFVGVLFSSPAQAPRSWRKTAALGLVSVCLLGGFYVVRYGNERQDAFTAQELLAVRHLYSIARPGSLVVTSSSNLPYKFQDYEKYHYALVGDDILAGDTNSITRLMRGSQYPAAYLILTRAQRAHLELFHGLAPAVWDEVEKTLRQSPALQLEFANDDAAIFVAINDKQGRQ